jgi:hypothetical protein
LQIVLHRLVDILTEFIDLTTDCFATFRLLFDDLHVRRYLTKMVTAISSKGQIVLPAEFRRQDGIETGQQFAIERLKQGEYRLTRCHPPANEGMVDWLLACPTKGFFNPIDSESTDTL